MLQEFFYTSSALIDYMDYRHVVLALKSTLLVLIAFAIVLFVRLAWTNWSGQFTISFIRTGRIEELVFLLLVGAVIAMVFGKLLQMAFRAETRPRPKRPYRRRR